MQGKIGAMLEVSLSQTVHADAMANLHMMEGKIVYDKKNYKWVAETSKSNFVQLAKQVDKIRERLQSTKHKVILCGDFNDSPTSYSYLTIRGNMKDAFRESGKGMSRTYIGKMPSFRIDYILHDNAWNSYNYQTNTLNFSDHKMVSCTIALPN
jgi:endonuclease/exonuclease/phosphatase (EEP) superfamily protein YafD